MKTWATRIGLGIALGLPVFLCFNFVYRFAVDVPYWDQWELVPMLAKSVDSTLTLADMFSQHNEHRIFFPRILMLDLAIGTAWDTRVEIWCGFLLSLGIGAVLFLEHLRTFGRTARAAMLFVPCAWIAFTLRQENNLLWGWQVQITLCVLGLCGAMALLVRSDGRSRFLVGAICCAIVSSFSFASGLAVWPAGAIALLWRFLLLRSPELRRVRLRRLAIWLVTGAASITLYLVGYAKPVGHPALGFFTEHPGASLHFLLTQVGGSLATEVDLPGAAAMGAALFVVLLGLLVASRRGLLDAELASFGVPLVCFAGACAAMVTVGRAGFLADSPNFGPASRYTTITMLGVIGLYRCCLALRPEGLRWAATLAVAALIFLGLFVTFDTAYPLATQVRREREAMRGALLDWRNRPDAELKALYPDPAVVRERAVVLERLHTSVFREPR